MIFAKVVGTVVCSLKYYELFGIRLYLVRLFENGTLSNIKIAGDSICAASQGDIVYLIDSSEAAASFRKGLVPIDLAIVGIVEQHHINCIPIGAMDNMSILYNIF